MFFRIQEPGISLDDMQNFVSEDGGDGYEDEGGVCACGSVADMISNTAFTTKYNMEVVVFKAQKIVEIYDGWRVYPTEIVDRIGAKLFYEMSFDAASIIHEYENN